MFAAIGIFTGAAAIFVSTTFSDNLHSKIAVYSGGFVTGFGVALQAATRINESLER